VEKCPVPPRLREWAAKAQKAFEGRIQDKSLPSKPVQREQRKSWKIPVVQISTPGQIRFECTFKCETQAEISSRVEFEEPNKGKREKGLSYLPSNKAGNIPFAVAISRLNTFYGLCPLPRVEMYQ
jgi:hypothetical protein